MKFVSSEGLRLDGRRPKELRRLACVLGCLAHADGSAQLQMGNTKVPPLHSPHASSASYSRNEPITFSAARRSRLGAATAVPSNRL